MDASTKGIGEVYRNSTGQWHIWKLPLNNKTKCFIIDDDNTRGGITFKKLQLCTYITHFHIFTPLVTPFVSPPHSKN